MSGTTHATTIPSVDGEIERRHMRKFIDSLVPAQDEARLHLDQDKIWVRLVDPASVLMVESHLTRAIFDSYDATAGVVGAEVKRISAYLSILQSKSVNVEVDDEAFTISDGFEQFQSTTIAPESLPEDPELPDIDDDNYVGEAVLTGQEFKRVVDGASEDGDELNIHSDPHEETLPFRGAEGGDFEECFEGDDVYVGGAGYSAFSLDYLVDVADAILASPPVKIRVGDEHPVEIEYPIKGGWKERRAGSIRYLMAPRIKGGSP